MSVDITSPVFWLPLAMTLALMLVSAQAFLRTTFTGRYPELVGWIVTMIWATATFAYIPFALGWLTTTTLYEWAYSTNEGIYIGVVPTAFMPALVIFVGGILYREITWLVMLLFARCVRPLVSYVFRQGWRALCRAWRLRYPPASPRGWDVIEGGPIG